ncbi:MULTISPECIES: hypothetical protein [Clostridium]|nr:MULTISPECIES: hypothetical protein [Clostridium]
MSTAFDKIKNICDRKLNFIADDYSTHPITKQQFKLESIIGLTNDAPVS